MNLTFPVSKIDEIMNAAAERYAKPLDASNDEAAKCAHAAEVIVFIGVALSTGKLLDSVQVRAVAGLIDHPHDDVLLQKLEDILS